MFPTSSAAQSSQAHEHASSTGTGAVQDAVATAGAYLPHGYCYLWNKPLLATHVVSDAVIGISYVVISLALVTLVHRARKDIPFSVLFVAFGLFIVACGMTHFMEIWTLWQPVYWLSGGVKALTAIASVTTAAVMPSAIPRVLTTIRTAALSRERELAAARTAALEEQNALLESQRIELEHQTEEAQALAEELEQTNLELREALQEAEAARLEAEEATRGARAANRAKSDFLAVMSHELRTPLNAIGGYADLMELGIRGPVTPQQREDLGRIQKSQRHLMGLINELLNFTRLEAGRVQYNLTDVPLEALLRDAEALVIPQGATKGLTVRVDPCAGGCTVRADADKLRQILLNLLSNALKFTPSGGEVALECSMDDGQVYLRVRDTGVGIAAERLGDVFEPFVQLDPRLTRETEGIGLGLSISRDLARGMGGDLTVTSHPGVGSVFTVVLPASGSR